MTTARLGLELGSASGAAPLAAAAPRSTRARSGVLKQALAALVFAFPAVTSAAPSFVVSPPVIDGQDLVFLLGGVSEEGGTLKPSSVEVEIDGEPAALPKAFEPFYDLAQAAAEADPTWKSPLAVGLVYLWIKEVPTTLSDALLEGAAGFLKRLPSRTNAYATLYGRKRQPIPKLKASEMGAYLHDLSYLDGDRPNLGDAIFVDLKSLVTDESPFKVLLVVTDGRDFTDPRGEGPADFFALANEIAKAQVRLFVVSFPAPDGDVEQSAKNLADLAGDTFHRAVDQPLELQSTLESLGQALADMRRVRLELPWSWRTFGGTHKLRLDLTIDGKRRAIEVGKITLPAATGWVAWLAGGLLGLLAVLVGVMLLLRRRPRLDSDEQVVLTAAHELIGRGLSAHRAVVELTRKFPESLASLAATDPSAQPDSRYPFLQTRAGRRRFEEIQALLRGSDTSRLGDDLAGALAQAISGQMPARQAAASISARVPEDERSYFLRLTLDEMARALREAGQRYPVLATPRSRGAVLAIQDALRSQPGVSLAIGWLVRAAGPGPRGETIRLTGSRAVLGRGQSCEFRFEADAQIAEQHAVIGETRGDFFIEPLQGPVKVENEPVTSLHPLGDGDTIEVGQGRYVWKCVSSGTMPAPHIRRRA